MNRSSFTYFLIISFLVIFSNQITTFAQESHHTAVELEISSHLGSGDQLPFWLLSNQYGKYTLANRGLLGALSIASQQDTTRVWDMQWGVEGIALVGETSNLWLHQGYGRIDFRNTIRLQAGIKEETFGNQYTSLSTGSIIWSQNARPMPKIELGSADFINVPYTKGIFQLKGSIAHGWFEKDRYVRGVWLHQKYASARTRFNFPLNFNFTFHHFAMWGGRHPEFGQLPKDFDAYLTVFLVGAGGDDAPVTEQLNRYGNHIGSRNFGIDWQQPSYSINAYFQDIYEDGSGARWNNFPDGLWGVVWKNENKAAPIAGVLYEYLQTINQSGPVHPPGDDNYFNHGIYLTGWTFNRMTIGTPFITSPIYNQQIDHASNHRIWNNRVLVHHVGVHGSILENLSYQMKVSYAENLGLHSSMGIPDDIFNFNAPSKQWHWVIDFGYRTKNPALSFNLGLALDKGPLYGENFAGRVGFKYVVF